MRVELKDWAIQIARKKTEKKVAENTVYLSKDTKVYWDKEQTLRVGIFGESGFGKSWTGGVIAGQFKNNLIFDPNGSVGFEKTLRKQGQFSFWEKFEISSDGEKTIKVNINELDPNALKTMTYGKGDLNIRRALSGFASLAKTNPKKNFHEFEKKLKNARLDYLLDELKIVFDEKDNGMPVEEIVKGNKLIDISQYNPQNSAIGALIEIIFSFKLKHPGTSFLIGIDDAQDSALSNTAVGRAFANIATKGRKYGISVMVIGTNQGKLDRGLKQGLNTFLLFPNTVELDSIEKTTGKKIYPEQFDAIRGKKGVCFFYTKLSPEPERITSIDANYYKTLKVDETMFGSPYIDLNDVL